ncbi:MAG: staygreen family protein [Dehalococcoidales bacterium]|nr:staygreen family protein [Dehalococcoidales bacterium]
MQRLNPEKLHVTYLAGATPDHLILPRRYTLNHSDITGNLFLSIGSAYDTKQISKLYTRLMRDEVLAELVREGENLVLKAYCHVSGGFIWGPAKFRYNIFKSELPLALEAIRYGDRVLFEHNPDLDKTPILIHFHSTNNRFNKVENWGTLLEYK